jgi:ABC-type multidrug transport system ATPase subunit
MRIEASNLALHVGERELFSGLDFVWEGPGFFAVIGASGVGKSTLLSAIMGWTRPSKGNLEVRPSKSVWFVPQNAPILDSRTVLENLEVALLAEDPESARQGTIADTLVAYRLDAVSQVLGKHLSGGERQRVALARAALRTPQVLLADEVTAGLDPTSVILVTGALLELATRALVVVATHDQRVWSEARVVLDLTEWAL